MIRAYLDNNATTRPHPDAVAAMRRYLDEFWLNPSSTAAVLLSGGDDPVRHACRSVGRLLGSQDLADEIVLTSGASESNSWAIAAATASPGHVVTSAIEHPSVRLAVRAAAARGMEVSVVPVDGSGIVDERAFRDALRPDTRLVSLMLANNETGVIQPIGRLASEARRVSPDVLVHTDATAAVGRIAIDLDGELADVDLLSLSGHKFHAPVGVGALFVRSGFDLAPMIFGKQAEGRRGGTYNAPTAAALAVAADLAWSRRGDMEEVAGLRTAFEEAIRRWDLGTTVNGADAPRLPTTASITFPGSDAARLVDELAAVGVCVSTGSACSAGARAPSAVLTAMGLSEADAGSTLRFSLSAETTEQELSIALSELERLARANAAVAPSDLGSARC